MEWSDSRSDRMIPGKEHTVRKELEAGWAPVKWNFLKYIYIYIM